MSSEQTPQLSMAHVLFMDIVGYSNRPMAEQRRLISELQELVRQTPEFQLCGDSDETIRLPTGDGMAIVFLRDPVAPVSCAMQLAEALKNRPHLEVRMGLHTGPVYVVTDINAQSNVSGGGINLAQRVMDCGDARHILLSREVAGLLNQVGSWPIHDLGECEVKHGAKIHLFSLHTDEIGNAALPSRLRRETSVRSPTPARIAVPAADSGPRVALLYKRSAEPDNYVLDLLETRLRDEGCQVFVDRHLEIGVEWASAIAREIRQADAVVPLLSAASISSEMLAWEVQEARDWAQKQRGKPRLLPVRINYTESLPETLAAVLDPIEYALWLSAGDDERLISSLLRGLNSPAEVAPITSREKMESVGGAVPLDSAFYIVRPADEVFLGAITRMDSIVLVKGARQMGKTSLLARGLQKAREAGAMVVRSDFQKLNANHLESADALFLKLASSIADQLDLDADPEDGWSARRGPSENFERFWRRDVLNKLDAPVVWGLDEVDRLFTCDFASEVFGLFRSWHNERALDPEGPWRRLTLAIAYATEAHLFISDVNQSPFNVGTRLTLEDFNRDQVADLNMRYGAPLRTPQEVARFANLLSGHPYLVRRGLDEMAATGMDLPTFEAQADRDEGVFGDHLRRILVLLAKDSGMCDIVRGVLRGMPCPTPESFYRLRSSGLAAGESARDVRLRCDLYQTYLARHLL